MIKTSVNRDLIPIALKHVLKTQSSFKLEAQQILVKLTMTCLNNVILQYLDKFDFNVQKMKLLLVKIIQYLKQIFACIINHSRWLKC